MRIWSKYLNLLKKILSVVLAHGDHYGLLVLLLYYGLFGGLYLGTPILAYKLGSLVSETVRGLAMLSCLIFVSFPLFPLILIMVFLIGERFFVLIGFYRLFDIQKFAFRSTIDNWVKG